MSAIKIHIKKVVINEQGCVRLDAEATKLLAEVATKSGKSVKYVASEIIKQAIQNNLIEFDEEEEEEEE